MATIFSDSFTVAADVNIEAYPATPDYSLMNGIAGDVKVNAANDRVQAPTAGTKFRVRCLNAACPTGDQEVSVRGTSDSATGVQTAVLARCHATLDDCYMMRINYDTNAMELWSYTLGIGSLIDTTASSYTSAGTHTYYLKAEGAGATVTLTFRIDALTPRVFADTSGARKTAGKAGLYLYNGTANTGWVDDFSVDDLIAGGSVANSYYYRANQ